MIKDMINFDNGKFKVINFLETRRDKQGKIRAYWNCICRCGKQTIKHTYQLTSGIPVSCGCYKQIRRGNSSNHDAIRKHGYSSTQSKLYKVWKNIKTRCYNQKNKGYKWWGAKGITICEEWKNNPKYFIEWCLNNGWNEELTIDRIDNKGNYEPNNCQFITRSENISKMNRQKKEYKSKQVASPTSA